MSEPPTVSALMPIYNVDRYLAAAIESILAQTWTDFELIIIDDGSTDGSGKILERYARRDERIKLSSRENRGISKTRNELLAQARGEFIAIVDGDDVSMPDRFARQVGFLRGHPNVLCVGSALDWIDEQDRHLGHCEMPQTDREIQSLLVGGISMLHHPCTMVRRSALLQVGGYDESLVASVDLDLWLRLGELGELANLPDTLLRYRLHSKSITHRRQNRQTSDAYAACQRAWQRRGIVGEFIRKPADHLHQHDFLLRCGWLSFNDGQREVARRCGLRAVAAQPLSVAAWKLLACSIVKPLPRQLVL
ncbi:glycosyltransferase [Phormidium tenue FACHB-886]|nr:glycosyltransferase [Phormidium tenue FACHB-886]